MVKERFSVSGMSCAACQANVERAVRKINGVKTVEVSLISSKMNVEYDPMLTNDAEIISAVCKIGYGADKSDGKTVKKEMKENSARTEQEGMRKRLLLSIAFMIPLMYIAMGHMIGLPMPSFFTGIQNALIGAITQMLIAIVVIFINRKFFTVGTKALIKGSPNMDSLIMIGSGASFIYGVIVIYRMAYSMGHQNLEAVSNHSHDLYFESAAMILTLVTLGKYLEARSKAKTTSAIDKLIDLTPKTATVLRDGTEVKIPSSEIVKGDVIVVKPGEAIAVDGRVVSGYGYVDQSSVTGESVPVKKSQGDTVISATLNKNGSFNFEATKVGEETTISQIIQMVERASETKAPIARLADKVSGIFVPAVITVSVITFITWLLLGYDVDFALSLAISVLVISCPCALGLATPVAIMAGTGKAAQYGILIKSAQALETLHGIDTVVLDKTGTVTKGEPSVTDISAFSISETELLKYAYSLESKSDHPLAKAVCKYAEAKGIKAMECEEFEYSSGKGIRAGLCGHSVITGNLAFMKENDIRYDESALSVNEKEPETLLYFAVDGSLAGIIAVADTIRDESISAVQALKKKGIKTVMLTGDNLNTARFIQKLAGIDEVMAELMPGDKEKAVRELQRKGRRVAMVGDGINDAPALTAADVGIAIGAGTDIAIDSADIVLMKSSLLDVVTALELGKKVVKNIKTNLFWAFFYNVLGIPLAAGVLYIPFAVKLSPMIGAAAMSLSSVCVVTNALRLYSFKNKYGIENNEIKEGEIKMEKVLKIEGMMCMHCKAHVEKALAAVEGTESVSVDLEAKTATVIAADPVTNEALVNAVTEAGYEVKSIE